MPTKILYILPPQTKKPMAVEPPDKGWWMPLGGLSIGSYIKREDPSIDFRIADGEHLDYPDIRAEITKGINFVLLNPNILNYEPSVELAELAKQKGACVLFGGHYVTNLGEIILEKYPFVDALVLHDGEISVTKIIKGVPFEHIDGLTFRDRTGRIKSNLPVELPSLDLYPEIDYNLIDLEPYFKKHEENYRKKFPECPYKRPLTMVTQRGCCWREGEGKDDRWSGCIYCSRIDWKWRGKDPRKIHQETLRWKKEKGIDSLVDVGDDFLTNPKWFDEYHQTRPVELSNVGLRCIYARPDPFVLTRERAAKLKELGCWAVLMGIESGDSEMLEVAMRGLKPEWHLEAVKNLHREGIRTSASFVLGIPGENKESLENTYRHAEELCKMGVDILFGSILNPHPGSYAWEQLIRRFPKYRDSDILDPIKMQEDFVNTYCEVNYGELIKFQERFLALKPEASVAEYKKELVSKIKKQNY